MPHDTALTPALAAALPLLRCPTCAAPFTHDGSPVVCASGHAFDVARQGYVNLAAGRATRGDTADMVAARERFLAAGHYAPIAAAVAAAAGADPAGRAGETDGAVLDLAGGTGYYLAAVLDAMPSARGIVTDTSAPALRRAARCHPRVAAIGANAWERLPVADGSAGVVLSIFGPRGAAEVARVLASEGRLVVVSPAAEHEQELIGPLGLIHVDPQKDDREAATFAAFRRAARDEVRYRIRLDHAGVADLVGMGPSARHVTAEERTRRIAALDGETTVTVAVRVTTYARP